METKKMVENLKSFSEIPQLNIDISNQLDNTPTKHIKNIRTFKELYFGNTGIEERKDILEFFYNEFREGLGYYFKNLKFLNEDEINSEIFEVILSSIFKYDEDKKTSFKTFVYKNIQYRVLDLLNENGSIENLDNKISDLENELSLYEKGSYDYKRVYSHIGVLKHKKSKNISYNNEDIDYLNEASEIDIEKEVGMKDLVKTIMEFSNNYKEGKYKDIFVDKYVNNLKLNEIGEKYGYSGERIRQICNELTSKIKEKYGFLYFN